MNVSTEHQHFAATKTELLKGINLIEASAGTGKTYAIAMLVARFVVEKQMSIEDLLIVTFTKAATEELKQRVRARLVEIKRALNKETGLDPALIEWLQQLEMSDALIRTRLALALLDIDQASIFTIHGFCQRVLKEHALESGQLFDSELVGSIDTIRQQLCDDFWRKQVYPRSALQVSALTAHYKTPDDLLKSIQNIDINSPVEPSLSPLDEVLKNFENCYQAVAGQFAKIHKQLAKKIAEDENKFKKDFLSGFVENSQSLHLWLEGESLLMPSLKGLALFTDTGLIAGLNGLKFKKTKDASSDERKAIFLGDLTISLECFDNLLEALNETTLMLRRSLLEYLQQALDKELQKLNVLSYDDLISRLSQALQGNKGACLQSGLRQRYQVALIDEFQDTDQAQWHIFSTVFASDQHYLFLIGDPKQAIYKFRGADIHSYFEAQKQATHRYTLKHNWRSHPALVSAVNKLYQRHKQPFLFDQLGFVEVEAALSADQGSIQQAGECSAPMVLWQLGNDEQGKQTWTAGKASIAIQAAVAEEILSLLNQARLLKKERSQALMPGDIAILVRSNNDAQCYQDVLQTIGIPSVINSQQSVFVSQEATGLLTLLQAIAYANEINYLKQALTLSWFNLDGAAFYRLTQNEHELDQWINRFQHYHQLWQNKGLMNMLSTCLAQESVWVNLAQQPLAERRLTNLNHLIEWLQQVAVDEHLGVHKILDWLQHAIDDQSELDEQQLRLESDEAAVKIITMHGSKGLEYPVVFCPGLWKQGGVGSNSDWVKCHENGQMLIDLGSDQFDQRKAIAEQEALAEDLRLLYVAITRAQYRCYMIWADVRTKQKPNLSALAYLLFSSGETDWQSSLESVDAQQQVTTMKALYQQSGDCFQYRLIPAVTQLSEPYQPVNQQDTLSALIAQRSLFSHWQMSSYSALASLSLHNAPELPIDQAQELDDADSSLTEENIPDIPKGAHTGNVVHDLLENIEFAALADRVDISEQRDAACRRYGLVLDKPERLNQLLESTVKTSLSRVDTGFCLANLLPQSCLKEMSFYYAVDSLSTQAINNMLSDCPTFQPLSDKTMQGYLTGFIDLVCEYQGRYYVMDYKTNGLSDYDAERMTEAMRVHNYGLQYWIYTLVLHQYLSRRIPDYNYDDHFGGVRYLFVRGMDESQPMSGVFEDYPPLEMLNELGDVLRRGV